MSDRWGPAFEENTKLRERVAVLERNLTYLQETIVALRTGQAENRAYSERSFAEVLRTQNELKQEIADLKIAVASHPIPTDEQNRIFMVVIAIGLGIAILIIVLLMLWVRLGTVGVHF